jgi:diguanylate cyclase (GGDEF)-like protein
MWILTLRSPSQRPVVYRIKPGKNSLGRQPDNDVLISDESASRRHAEIYCHENNLVITDLSSTNGTFVNRQRLVQPLVLRSGDQIRIGQQVANITYRGDKNGGELISALSKTRPLTRDLLLASVDQHAVLLYEVASRLNTILDLKTAMQEVSRLMLDSMGAEKCEVILAERFGQMSELGFPTSIAQQAIDQRAVVVIPDLAALTEQLPSQSAMLMRIRSVLCVPVIVEDAVAALIYVFKTDPSARPFDENDVQLSVAISHQTALTIQRANLIERSRILEENLNIDSLTGLATREHFMRSSELEFQRAVRFHHDMTMIMLDIDNFKQVNDTYGHIAGNQVLDELAERCQSQVRSIDLIGRFGGDEFIILLMETNPEDALNVTERIRHQIAGTPVMTEKGLLEITVSMGMAHLGVDCLDLVTLISRADSALYQAKNGGRNQVVVAA